MDRQSWAMSISKRVTQWARRACAVINAMRTVVIALRRLLMALTLLTATALIWANQVIPIVLR